MPDSEFRRWRIARNKRLLIVCIIAIPIGFLFAGSRPETTIYVSGLGLLGAVVSAFRLSRLNRK